MRSAGDRDSGSVDPDISRQRGSDRGIRGRSPPAGTIFNKQANERRFYERFFARAEFATDLTAIFDLGEKKAAKSGVGSMDSLHLAAAHLLKADAFLTTEGPKKSIHQSLLVKVVCLFS